MVTNPKIEKKKADITRTQAKLAEVRAKLREQKHELIRLENDEIVAMFRNEIITEDDFAALMRARREAELEDEDLMLAETTETQNKREEKQDAFIEN
jgi:hypothetical protein